MRWETMQRWKSCCQGRHVCTATCASPQVCRVVAPSRYGGQLRRCGGQVATALQQHGGVGLRGEPRLAIKGRRKDVTTSHDLPSSGRQDKPEDEHEVQHGLCCYVAMGVSRTGSAWFDDDSALVLLAVSVTLAGAATFLAGPSYRIAAAIRADRHSRAELGAPHPSLDALRRARPEVVAAAAVGAPFCSNGRHPREPRGERRQPRQGRRRAGGGDGAHDDEDNEDNEENDDATTDDR